VALIIKMIFAIKNAIAKLITIAKEVRGFMDTNNTSDLLVLQLLFYFLH